MSAHTNCVSRWERDFVDSVMFNLGMGKQKQISEKQAAVLVTICNKIALKHGMDMAA